MILKLNAGEVIFFSLGFITYVPQFIFHIISEHSYKDYYTVGENGQIYFLFIIFFYVLVIAINRMLPVVNIGVAKYFRFLANIVYSSKFEIFVSIVGLCLSAYFYVNYGVDFRQVDRFSDAGALVVVVFLVQSYMQTWFILLVFRVAESGEYKSFHRLTSLLFTVSLFLTLTGSLNMIFLIWGIILTLLPARSILKIFVLKADGGGGFKKLSLFLLFFLVFVVSLILIVSVGFINKLGYDGALDKFNTLGFLILEQIIVRLSSSYASAISFARNHLYDWNVYDIVWSITPDNLLYRLSKIFNFDGSLPRPEITQINRLNYLFYTYDNHLDHAGASPGIVASALYLAPFPVGYILISLYSVFFIRLWGGVSRKITKHFKLMTLLFLMTMSFSMLESPMDYLLIIEPSLFYLVFLLLIFLRIQGAKNARYDCFCNNSG